VSGERQAGAGGKGVSACHSHCSLVIEVVMSLFEKCDGNFQL